MRKIIERIFETVRENLFVVLLAVGMLLSRMYTEEVRDARMATMQEEVQAKRFVGAAEVNTLPNKAPEGMVPAGLRSLIP